MNLFVYTILTLKAPITNAVDGIHKYFFLCFSEKIKLDVSSKYSARQRIHMKNQALFSSKDKSKKLKFRLQQFLYGALRVNQDPFLNMFFRSEDTLTTLCSFAESLF